MVTGHGNIKSYLYKYKIIDSPMCPCKNGEQTTDHMLHYCELVGSPKMAAEEKLRVNEALETLLSIMEKSGNLRKDLKNDIHESVSTIRKAFNILCKQLDRVKEEYSSYRKEATGGPNQTNEQVATSIDYTLQTWNNTADRDTYSQGKETLLRNGQKRQQTTQNNPEIVGHDNHTGTDKVPTEKQHKPN